MEFTMATAAMVDPGPTGVSRLSMIDKASAEGVQVDNEVGFVEQPAASTGFGSADIDWATDVTAMTRRPRWRAPRHLDRHRGQAAGGEDDHHVVGPKAEVGQDDLGQARHALDGHRLALAVRAHDLVWNVIDSSTIGFQPGYDP